MSLVRKPCLIATIPLSVCLLSPTFFHVLPCIFRVLDLCMHFHSPKGSSPIVGWRLHPPGQHTAHTSQDASITPLYSDLGEKRVMNICLRLLDDCEKLSVKLWAVLCPVQHVWSGFRCPATAKHEPLLHTIVITLDYLTFLLTSSLETQTCCHWDAQLGRVMCSWH